MKQFDQVLFPDPNFLAKRDDPETSKQAAKIVAPTIQDKEREAVAFVRAYPGRTQNEIDQLVGNRSVSKRLRGAERKGLVKTGGQRKDRLTKQTALTWYAV